MHENNHKNIWYTKKSSKNLFPGISFPRNFSEWPLLVYPEIESPWFFQVFQAKISFFLITEKVHDAKKKYTYFPYKLPLD